MLIDAVMLNVGTARQLFLDDLVIESVENVRRTWHEPERHAENPILAKDLPWEHVLDFGTNSFQVYRDPKDGLFKCWYVNWDFPGVQPGEFPLGATRYTILYAESEDGIRWRKPALDAQLVDGQMTNIVVPNGYDPAVMIDSLETDEMKRLKIIYTHYLPGLDVDANAVRAAYSADGIHWTHTPELPAFGTSGSHLDDVILLDRELAGRTYFMNTRHNDMYAVARNLKNPVVGHFTPPHYPFDWARQLKRRIFRADSADMIHWSDPYLVLSPEDGLDDLDEAFYGMRQFLVGNLWVGFLTVFHYVPNTVGVRLVCSRDGRNWQHLNKRQPFLSMGDPGAWDEFIVAMPTKPIEVGDELFIFYGGSWSHHDWWLTGAREHLSCPEATDVNQVGCGMGLAKLRLDGFASLGATVRPGILITRPLISGGTRLVVNARCRPGGSLTAEMVDVHDDVLPGFSRAECDVFTGDNVRHTFTWGGKSHIPVGATERPAYPNPETGRFRKIRFYLEEAELYSFTLAAG